MKSSLWRWVKAETEKLGLTIVSVEEGEHHKIRVAYQGRSALWVIGGTPSDWRAEKNNIARLRRINAWLRSDPTPASRQEVKLG